MDNRRAKRKRKSFASYLKWERYQGKRKRFGKGTFIDEDTFNYFLRVMEVKISDFTTVEDKEIFIDNVFEQTAGREMDISCNQVGSRAVETFLPWAHNKILLRFTYVLSKDLRKICCDEFGSHVLQQLVVVVTARLQEIENSSSDQEPSEESQSSAPDMSARFKKWLLQVCQFVINNLEEFVWEESTNHIIRTVLECLSGLPPGSTSGEKKWQKKEGVPIAEQKVSPIDSGFSLVQECASHILQMPQIFDNVYTNSISGLLQTILATVHKVDNELSGKIVCHLLDHCFDPELPDNTDKNNQWATIPEVFMSQAATHLMDVMISIAEEETFTQIYTRCFNEKLKILSLAPYANFCVQGLIKHCKEKTEFESIFEELLPSFEALLYNNKHGVLLALCQSCHRFKCKQNEFMKQLQVALHCDGSERQVFYPLLVIHLVNYETWCEASEDGNENRDLPVTLSGSLILQTMLNFMAPMKVLTPLLDMNSKHLLNILCDRTGSYIGDTFFDSETIGGKKKVKFFQKLQGSFVALAISKYGSRVLDKIWLWAPLNTKKLILGELAASEAIVNSVPWGSKFAQKQGLSLFKRRPKDWEESETRRTRTEKLFADIIGT